MLNLNNLNTIIEYNINHNLIREKTINIFLKQKPIYLLSENTGEQPIDYNNDDTPTIDNKQEKEDIKNLRKNKQYKKQETIHDLKEEIRDNNKEQQKTTDDLKERMKINHKKQQETIESLKQEMITLKESFNNEKQPKTNNLTINNNHEEPMGEELLMISSILKDSTINNSLIRDIMDKSIINDIMNEQIDDALKELLINDTLKCSMRRKILIQPINEKDSLIKEPTINNILTHPMNNNVKKSLINEAFNQSEISNTFKTN